MLSEGTLKKKYGISTDEFNGIFQKQGGVCAICKCKQRYQTLAVDHDHKTKHVRGLLCMHCNRGLGHYFDSPIRLRRAADYIEASRRGHVGTAPSTVDELTSIPHARPIDEGANDAQLNEVSRSN